MSDDGTMTSGSGAANTSRADKPRLYDASGAPVYRNSRPTEAQADQLAQFIQQQPITSALIALIAGYFLGKIT